MLVVAYVLDVADVVTTVSWEIIMAQPGSFFRSTKLVDCDHVAHDIISMYEVGLEKSVRVTARLPIL